MVLFAQFLNFYPTVFGMFFDLPFSTLMQETFLKRFYVFIFRERGEGREKERERDIDGAEKLIGCLLHAPTPATQACALTGNLSGDLSLCRTTLIQVKSGLQENFNSAHLVMNRPSWLTFHLKIWGRNTAMAPLPG